MKRILFIVTLLVMGMASNSQPAKEKGYSTITMESIQGQLEFLASDWMEGRATGSKGIYMASDYIASMF
jgi:3-hydroxy-3-methylglutaryl CoA synthase